MFGYIREADQRGLQEALCRTIEAYLALRPEAQKAQRQAFVVVADVIPGPGTQVMGVYGP